MKPTRLDRALLHIAPRYGLSRLRARAIAETLTRHYDAAQGGRRTEGWRRSATDANGAIAAALPVLRQHARDLVRNNPWARRGKRVVANSTVGWGILPKPIGDANAHAVKRARKLWAEWGETTQCDVEGQRNFSGLQRLVMETVAESGEAIVRRYVTPGRGLAIPLQLQVLEPDYLDTTRDLIATADGGKILQGIEFDKRGRRVAYWLFPEHPGASNQFGTSRLVGVSKRIPADEVIHVYYKDRPGQVRGVTWYAPVIVKLRDFDEYDDATLLRQKIAACFAAFVTDPDGAQVPVGDKSEEPNADPLVETIEPGTVVHLPIGKSIEFARPPAAPEASFDERQLRAIAAGLGITYEDLTGDYSRVNFSSGRLGRIAHADNVHDWRWNMLIPMFCEPAWTWAMDTAYIAGLIADQPAAAWTPPSVATIDPEKETRSDILRVRGGHATPDEIVREKGFDPDTFWQEYADNLERLDRLRIVLDSDPRKRTQVGNSTELTASEESPGKAGNSKE
jgi:lambda family phage portal protein